MEEKFGTIVEVLDYWQFCPICKKRNGVILQLDSEDRGVLSERNNSDLIITYNSQTEDNKTYINIWTGKIVGNCKELQDNNLNLYLECSKRHFNIMFTLNQNKDLIRSVSMNQLFVRVDRRGYRKYEYCDLLIKYDDKITKLNVYNEKESFYTYNFLIRIDSFRRADIWNRINTLLLFDNS